MSKKFKHSIWHLSIKLFLTYVFIAIINLIFLNSLFGIFEDNDVWLWMLTFITIAVDGFLIFLLVAKQGHLDTKLDEINKKTSKDNNLINKNVFTAYKGFIAGAIAQMPIITIFIVWFIAQSSGKELIIMEIIIKMFFNQYFKFISLWDINVFSVILFLVFNVLISGLSYIGGKLHRKKILSKINRNEEKIQRK